MCRSGVGSILVIFDVLDCYILYMCLLLFVYCILYTYFRGSPARETDKIGKRLKKFLGQCGTRVGAGLRGVRSSARWNRRT
jgi:hypothetical protein